jgi:hypothetical protein
LLLFSDLDPQTDLTSTADLLFRSDVTHFCLCTLSGLLMILPRLSFPSLQPTRSTEAVVDGLLFRLLPSRPRKWLLLLTTSRQERKRILRYKMSWCAATTKDPVTSTYVRESWLFGRWPYKYKMSCSRTCTVISKNYQGPGDR